MLNILLVSCNVVQYICNQVDSIMQTHTHTTQVSFDVKQAGSKFQGFILVPISISEVNKLP